METKIKTYYSDRVWLNDEDSPSMGSLVCFDGIEIDKDGKEYPIKKIVVSDCFTKVRIHQAQYDTDEDFLNKMILFRDKLTDFIEHLQNKMKE